MRKFSNEEIQSEYNKYSKNVTKEDIPDILGKQMSIMEKVRGPLAKFAEDIKLLFSMVKDYASGAYTEIPWTTIVSIVGALVYVFSPIDLIPDFIIGLGLIDDAAVIGICLSSLYADLQKYKTWKRYTPAAIEDKTGRMPKAPVIDDAEAANTREIQDIEDLRAAEIPAEIQREDYDEELRRMEEQHSERMKALQDALERTTKTFAAAAGAGALAERKYNSEKPEIEDVQLLRKQLEKKRLEFRPAAVQLEKSVQEAAQIGFDLMLHETEKIKAGAGVFIDTNNIKQKFDRLVWEMEGSITDVINRRVSLGDAECIAILERNSRGEREDGLYDFLKRIIAESVRSAQERIDEVVWDALVVVSFVITNKINDKKRQLQSSVEEYASMKKALSENEITAKATQCHEELGEIDGFLNLIVRL